MTVIREDLVQRTHLIKFSCSFSYEFADHHLIENIKIITDPNEANAGCPACLRIQIGKNPNFCTTPILPELTDGSTKMFSGSEIGDCKDFRININLPLDEVTFQHETTNGWKGQLVLVNTKHNSYKCPIIDWLDSDDPDYKSSFETSCTAAGK